MKRRAAGLILLAALAGACGVPLMRLPTGIGVHADDAGDALGEATATCRRVQTLTADVGIEGSVAGGVWGCVVIFCSSGMSRAVGREERFSKVERL